MQATVDISKAEAILGWMSTRELLWLARRASENKLIVEFGSYHGRSTRALADNCVNGRIWAVDPWNGDYPSANGQPLENINTYCYPQFCYNLKEHIESKLVVPYRGFSHSFKLPYNVDMVFIDGDHRYETVLKDIDKALELLRYGGIICGHDYNWDSVKKAVDEKLGSVTVEDSIWWKIKS